MTTEPNKASLLNQVVNHLLRLMDMFISDVFRRNMDEHYKVRLLVGCILSILAGIVSFGPIFVTIDAMPREAALFYFIFGLPTATFLLALLYLLRRGDHYIFAAYSVAVIATVVLFGGILITGGPALTEMLPMLFVPMVLAFIMLGLKAGLFFSALVAAAAAVLFFMAHSGFVFHNVAPKETLYALRIFNWSYAFFTVAALVAIFEIMNQRLKQERDEERQRLQYMATHDGLTGLPNRKFFDEALANTLAMADRSNSRVGIGIMDLNGFKPINDEIGHKAGDTVLQAISSRMHESVRKTDIIARIGGDEFALIVSNIKSDQDIATVCEKLLEIVARPVTLDNGQTVSVSGSLGLAIFPDDSRDENTLRAMADKTMYHAKHSNKGWLHYHPDFTDAS